MTDHDFSDRLVRIEESLKTILQNQVDLKLIERKVIVLETKQNAVVGFFASIGAFIAIIIGAFHFNINLH